MGNDGSRCGENNGTYAPTLALVHIAQRTDMLAPEDDWTGLSSPEERRRLQNRLNQRAYSEYLCLSDPATNTSKSKLFCGHDRTGNTPTEEGRLRATKQSVERTSAVQYTAPIMQLEPPLDIQKISAHIQACSNDNYILGSPTADHLLTQVKFNAYRAMVRNISTLGLTMESMEDEAVSPFYIFPIPTMRDNLVSAGDSFDDVQLCIDIMVLDGLILWGEQWDPFGWEVTEAFVKNWGWVIRGCHEIFESTNYWRGRRGEEPLIFNIP
ncbi:hypothetical protein V1515DRAFT_616762 [Lipomyces mesembrius]